MATILIFLLSGSSGFFWQRYSIKTVFPDVAGLKEGAPVRLAGVDVGTVTGVAFVGDRVEVVDGGARGEPAADHDHVGGDARVGVAARRSRPSTSPRRAVARRFPIGGTCRRGAPSASLSNVAEQASAGLEEATALLQGHPRRDAARLGRLFTDEALYHELTGLVQSAETGGQQHQSGPRHARPAGERSRGGAGARGLAREPSGH